MYQTARLAPRRLLSAKGGAVGVKFGLFDHMTRPPGTALHELYERRIAAVVRAEGAGVHGYYVAEHHGHRLAMAPSQLVWLAALARETERIRLGTMVACLPLHHPLRLAEEICMVDQLSQGRLELGVGRGISPFEQNFFGHPADEARGRFQESLELILSALTTGRMNTEGRTYYTFPEAELSMETYQKPGVPIWYPGNIEYAGLNGFNAVVPTPPNAAQRAAYQGFIDAGLASGDRLNPRSSDATLACSQFLVVARTDEEARDIAYRNVTALNNLMRRSSSAAPPHLQDPLPPLPDDPAVPFSAAGAFQREVAICGSPQTVRDYFLARAGENVDSYFMVGTAIGDMSLAESEESLRLFLNEVLPAFHDAA